MATSTTEPRRPGAGGGTSGRRARGDTVERFLPVAMLVVLAVIAAAILPSALRPPNQQPNQTAALSPDAPPSDDPEAIVASLNRARSGVGGPTGGEATGPGEPGSAPPTSLAPRACPHGVGSPPRQVESIYAPGCAAPFVGDNGGATYRGVTKDEIRLAVRSTGNRGSNSDNCDTNGELDAMDPLTFNPAERTFYVLEQYFNLNFQFYGRQLKFFCVQPEGGSIAQEQAAAALADSYGVYGAMFSSTVGCAEFTRMKMVAICEGLQDDQYAKAFPYKWASFETETMQDEMVVEYVCKKLVGKKADYAGTADLQSRERKFGIITYDNRDYGQGVPLMTKGIKACGGGDVKVVYATVGTDTTEGSAQLASAATQFQQDRVTTVIPLMDVIADAALTNAAQSQGYIPEWLVTDAGAISQNQLGGLQNQVEWAHAFGFTFLDAQRPNTSTECYRAYRSIDAANSPQFVICDYLWRALMLYAGSIQEAGPKLNPLTQADGFRKLGRYWDRPTWALGGNYSADRFGYLGDVTELFWDTTASDPTGVSNVGAYRYIDGARRYCPGYMSSTLKPFQNENAPSLVPDYEEPAIGPSKATCLEAHPASGP